LRKFTATALKEYLSDSDSQPLILDVREPWEYSICHLDKSIHIPMNQIPARIQELESGQETVIICHHGIRSAKVGNFLLQQGFDKIINLEGGIDAWARDVDTSLSTY
jgi:rhodanese-related sulfurtransferase